MMKQHSALLISQQRIFIVAYFIARYFKEKLVSVPRRWRDNRAETCSYMKHCTHKLQNKESVGVI